MPLDRSANLETKLQKTQTHWVVEVIAYPVEARRPPRPAKQLRFLLQRKRYVPHQFFPKPPSQNQARRWVKDGVSGDTAHLVLHAYLASPLRLHKMPFGRRLCVLGRCVNTMLHPEEGRRSNLVRMEGGYTTNETACFPRSVGYCLSHHV